MRFHRAIFVLLACTASAVAEPLVDPSGYRLPTPHPSFVFPRDHGSHPEFKIEWWYITGHLHDDAGARFGFQATFFRYALAPGHATEDSASFGAHQLFLAHMALADLDGRRFYHEERLNREGWDAYARTGRLDVRNGNWSLRWEDDGSMRLHGSIRADARFTLRLEPRKGPVLFGEGGLSRKGVSESAASWYITFPRLGVSGDLTLNGTTRRVSGEAWMDHEISSSQLEADQVGWDWASLRFRDGREIMVYLLRRRDGSVDPASTLAWVDEQGAVHSYTPDDFTWAPRRLWESPETGGRYPLEVDLTAPHPPGRGEGSSTVRIRPLMDEQEMVGHIGGVSYWEGACEILDQAGAVIGEAYMELTGYADELTGALR